MTGLLQLIAFNVSLCNSSVNS